MHHHFLKIALNFSAVVLLFALIAAPFYFAHKSTEVAGVKTETLYLIVSQVEKFPGIEFSQKGQSYTLSLPGSADAYVGVLILTNPTDSIKTYSIEGSQDIFFGENLEDQISSVSLPSGTSVPISVFSPESKEVDFKII